MENKLEILWDALLSRDSALIWKAYKNLSSDEQIAVISHLRRMKREEGWHIEQQISAQIALVTIESKID
jgi:hypothetical protein